MPKQSLVIGVGQFGGALARGLAEQGSEVLAVDSDESAIRRVLPHVADAIVMDAADEEALRSLCPQDREVCICALGENDREGSIMVTAMLRQMDAPQIVARATDDLHARVLRMVGAHEVVQPERDYGERLAKRLVWNGVFRVLPLGGELILTELDVPEAFWGQTLAELRLPERFNAVVAAHRRDGEDETQLALCDPHRPLQRGDSLVLVSSETNVRKLSELC
ncbi:MAG: potassium channel family protein [Nannocystaceae bacterium]|nr:TrkA family potassium uptake protein [bacterium]